MSKPRYLYIDDENDASVEAVRDGFNDENQIEIVVEQPQDFKSQKLDLLNKLKEYDGLLLDLRLDQNMQLDVSYNAPTIAQELRTIVTNPKYELRPCPIILCSTDERMRATYDVDKTSHDLFDYKFLKGSEPNWPKFSKKMAALARGYQLLRGNELNIFNVLGRKDYSRIDSRITERFLDPQESKTAYDYAHFVVKELFHHPGALIKERVLAARLGIDIEASKEAWIELRDNYFKSDKYEGLFSDGWDRWWSDKIITRFKEISGGKRLATLIASDRVNIIKEKLKINGLISAKPILYSKSSLFWTICEEFKTPLDPLEGFRVFETTDLKPWQEGKYLSFNAIVGKGINKDKGLRPHPSEKDRIKLMKENLSKL